MNDNLSLLSSIRDFALSYLWRRLSDTLIFWDCVKTLMSSLLSSTRDFAISHLWRRLSDTLIFWDCVKTLISPLRSSLHDIPVPMAFSGALVLYLFILNPNIMENDLFGTAFAVAGIIGASIAIIFSFSSFILQTTADLFSSQHLEHFTKDLKGEKAFGVLIFLTIASLSIPAISPKYALAYLLIILLIAFSIIYDLYLELRKNLNPKVFLDKIKDEAIEKLERIREKYARMSGNIPENNEKIEMSNPALGHVKYLHEVGLRLLARNEIHFFNLAVQYIQDIYLKHLELGNNYFIRRPSSIWGSYDCDDGRVTAQTLECLQSMGIRAIEEKRKDNIFALLHVYKNIIERTLYIKYAGDLQVKANPLLGASFLYYRKFIEALLASKESDWVLGTTSSLSNVSEIALQKTDDSYAFSQIHEMMSMVPDRCPDETRDACLLQLADTYFNQIKGAWNKHRGTALFWEKLFQGLEKVILLLSPSLGGGSILNDFFLDFYRWQENSAGEVLDLKHKEGQKEYLSDFVTLLEKWSEFLLNFARKNGLNTAAGFFIVYSVRSNLNIVYRIRSRQQKSENMYEIYKIQFDVFSLYFRNTDKLDDHLRNLDLVLETLLQEICNNLEHKFFDVNYLIKKYVELIEQHFDAVGTGDEYTRPRIIEKLVYLGLLLNKYKKSSEETEILSKIDELNSKHLLSHKGSLQLCKEIHDLGQNLFVDRSFDNLEKILDDNITKEIWDDFVKKINYCKICKYNLTSFDSIRSYTFPPSN